MTAVASLGKPIGRRPFLHILAASAGTSLWDLSRRASGADDDNDGFVLGMQTYSMNFLPVSKALEISKEVGAKTLDFSTGHLSTKASQTEIDAVMSQVKSLGLKPLSHGVNPFTNNHADNRKIFEFAKRAGLRNLSADPSEDSFNSLEKLVVEFDIRIAVHNHGPNSRYDKLVDVLRALKGRHPLIGTCVDLGHYIRSNEDPVRAISQLSGRIYGVHLKDFAEPKANTKGTILGRGQLNLVETFRALRKANVPADACLALEYETPGETRKDPVEDIRQCMVAAVEAAKRSRG